ncbi:hypothetical protein BDU57DRAFT_328226 [Ampelomyces quisqualis]|uniref:Uncharacterized protein n=1 Tax=Ampelomyces quisqualis TaxID=50730 RepID=A0A6A5QGJ5_AMPQU|nr:hypothetical protein BDU57DRAFT_328226 [Ampelomyces quisqualis]
MSIQSVTFSPREMEVLALAWQCMESQPKIDMNKLASLTGYTPGSASVTFGNIKRKIKLLGEDLAAGGPATPKKGGGPGRSKSTGGTPKSTGKRGASKSVGADDESPTKRSRKTTAKMNRDDDDDEEIFAPRVKKEELADITSGANSFYDQLGNAAAGYASERGDASDN